MTSNSSGKKKYPSVRTGLEVEMFVLDSDGRVVPYADEILEAVHRMSPETRVIKECARNMVEFLCEPSFVYAEAALSLLENVQRGSEVMEEMGFHLYPLATYPGVFRPEMRKTGWYGVKREILGRKKFRIGGRCLGFHCHTQLPKGAFDRKELFLSMFMRRGLRRAVVDSYNLLVAADPALTTFMQCSPFVQGRYLAKDSRVVIYRGGRHLGYDEGLYADFELFGALQPYVDSFSDLVESVLERHDRWENLIVERGFEKQTVLDYGGALDYSWNPVKVNKHGTMEQRGMDMNHLPYVIASGVLMKYIIRKIHMDDIKVVFSDVGFEEPFKLEGNTLYIPPQGRVRMDLQYLSAVEGLASKDVHHYCHNFLRFVMDGMNPKYCPLAKPLEKVLKRKRTFSDEIIGYFKKKGYSTETMIPNEAAGEFALKQSERFSKEIPKLVRFLKPMTEV
jgi:hypothetical protein